MTFFKKLSKIPSSFKKAVRETQAWTPAELEALRKGVGVFGAGAWMQIKRHTRTLQHRSTVSLKDKWRNELKKMKTRRKLRMQER